MGLATQPEVVNEQPEVVNEQVCVCGKMANLHEKHQRILADMLREEANRTCGDCASRGMHYVCVYL